jgi:uncharacterized linocin/CFP29 family protein
MSDHLLRGRAPISDAGWTLIDDEARARVTPGLGARKLIDFTGPLGWAHSATNLGRVERVEQGAPEGVETRVRRVLPLVELRVPFTVAREELRAGDRGAEDVDFDPLAAAARKLMECENAAVFHGWKAAGIEGVSACSSHDELEQGADFSQFTRCVASGVERLMRCGVGGPYGLALGRETWTRVVESSEHGGYPLLRHLREIVDGPIAWTPGVQGAVIVSLRGGDFLFECGQDISVGYDHHDTEAIELYLEESFSFRVVTPEAAIPIVVKP